MRILIAFTITLLVYILLIYFYLNNFREIKLNKNGFIEKSIIKIDILNSPQKKNIVKDKIVKKELKREKVKKIVEKNIKKSHISKKKFVKKKIKKRKLLSNKKFIPESEMLYIPNPIIKQKIEIKNSVSGDNIELEVDKSYPSSEVKKLYGEEFHSYTPIQKRFIKQNLDEIQKITQETLWRRGYPGGITSARTGQEGTNIVSFFLHPNGNISNLKLILVC